MEEIKVEFEVIKKRFELYNDLSDLFYNIERHKKTEQFMKYLYDDLGKTTSVKQLEFYLYYNFYTIIDFLGLPEFV